MQRNPMSKAGLAVSAGLIAAATVWAAPAHADLIDDSFLSALGGAGLNLGNSSETTTLGQSVCSMLEQPAGTFASAASGITGNSSMSPEMAELFTKIAVSVYCPQMMSELANGQLPQLPGSSGLSGIPGLGGIPGIGGLGGIPGL